jgi:hypothetical protein
MFRFRQRLFRPFTLSDLFSSNIDADNLFRSVVSGNPVCVQCTFKIQSRARFTCDFDFQDRQAVAGILLAIASACSARFGKIPRKGLPIYPDAGIPFSSVQRSLIQKAEFSIKYKEFYRANGIRVPNSAWNGLKPGISSFKLVEALDSSRLLFFHIIGGRIGGRLSLGIAASAYLRFIDFSTEDCKALSQTLG